MFAIKSNINIQNPPVNELWNSSKMHWKTFLQNPLRPSRSARYGNDRNKKTVSTSPSGRFSALPFLLILYTRMIHPPLFATKSNNGPRLVSSYIKNPLFTRIFSISIQNNISSDCVYFLLFVTKIVIKEPRPIKGMALIITLHFQAFSFHSVLLQHLRDCICSL